ncbi:MAG: ABC transporter ATP-binding protein [Clostridia bacterium]|nr:ABC transporter ATP-binding protein [Clostridia bacterium]
MIVMENVCKSYGGTQVLCGVQLHVRPGEYTALVGPSGSGKSTLMHILGCLDTPTSGIYRVDGEDVSHMDEKALCILRRDKIGFVFQGYQLIARMTAAQNVAFPLMLRGVGPKERLAQAAEYLRQVGLAGYENQRPSCMSGGQQQRVALARALCARPRLLLCDEPTGALDPESRDGILELLDGLHNSGHTIVLITHDMQAASRAQSIYRVQDGTLQPGRG